MAPEILYIDCFSGVSGDMLLGAFLDLGFPEERLREVLRPFGLGTTFDMETAVTLRHGLAARRVEFKSRGPAAPLAGAASYREIRELLSSRPLPETVRQTALEIFAHLARAEARVHRQPPAEVHFHEVGGIDSLADIVGVAAALSWCAPAAVYAAAIPLGRGFTRCRHGRLPVPVPAVVELLRGIPVRQTEVPAELTTPTGAAIMKTVVDRFELSATWSWEITAVGYGAGQRHLESQPNLLRLCRGRRLAAAGRQESGNYRRETVLLLETTIDDLSPEYLGRLREQLQRAGALETVVIPGQGKKGRPVFVFRILLAGDREAAVIACLFRHSSTLGVRRLPLERYVLARKTTRFSSPLGDVRIKIASDNSGKTMNVKVEYEDLVRAAERCGLSLAAAERRIMAAWQAAGNQETVAEDGEVRP